MNPITTTHLSTANCQLSTTANREPSTVNHLQPSTAIPPATFRVQLSQNQWILRHPHIETPIFTHPEKEEILRLLPLYFQRFQQNAVVKILDSFGRIMEERRFN